MKNIYFTGVSVSREPGKEKLFGNENFERSGVKLGGAFNGL